VVNEGLGGSKEGGWCSVILTSKDVVQVLEGNMGADWYLTERHEEYGGIQKQVNTVCHRSGRDGPGDDEVGLY
jgi:hypothetical protein